MPPFHHQCRTEIAALTSEEAEAEGVSEASPKLENEPDDGFGGAPSVRGEDWEPDPDAYSKDVGEVLRDRLGL